MNINLEALGLDRKTIEDRVVQCIKEDLLSGTAREEGSEYTIPSKLKKELDETLQKSIDTAIDRIAAEHLLPKITSQIEGLVLQQTNRWGEKVGTPVTFVEYLTGRAEEYMKEPVNFDGKTKSELGGYDFRPAGPRLSVMIDKHLQWAIETAMKDAMKSATSQIAEGITEAVKTKLAEIQKRIVAKVEVK